MMQAQTALAQYESVRHRLPVFTRTGACEPVGDLSELANRFDTFFLDAFGVLNIGEAAIPGVPERIATLQRAGKRVMVLTNAASLPHTVLLEKYARLGYHFAPRDVISSRDVLLSQFAPADGEQWGVVAPPGLQSEALDKLPVVFLEQDAADYETVDGVLFLGAGEWTAQRQTMLEMALRKRPRPVWVGNPDIVAPREHGFSLEPGYYAHELADRLGLAPVFFGKPFPNIFETALDRLGPDADRDRIVMVGDSLHTDILGAHSSGLASALVAGYGFLAGLPVEDEIARTGISPDFVLAAP